MRSFATHTTCTHKGAKATRRLRPPVTLLIAACLTITAIARAGEAVSAAPETGRPLVTHFRPRDYAGSPAVTRLGILPRDGRLVMTSGTLVHLYDGQSWLSIDTGIPGLRSLACDPEGRIWTSGVDGLGWRESTPEGQWSFHSLMDKLPSEHARPGRFWDTVARADGIWFATEARILRWWQGHFDIWEFPGTGTLIEAGGRLFFQRKGLSFLEWNGSSFQELTRAEAATRASLMRLYPIDGDTLEGVCSDGGVFHLKGGSLVAASTRVEAVTKRNRRIICATPRTQPGGWFLGTDQGLLEASPEGTLEKILNAKAGLSDSPVMDLLPDPEGRNLWVATLSGLYRLALPQAASYLGDQDGLPEGICQDMLRHEGALLLSSPTGVLRLTCGTEGYPSLFTPYENSPRYPQKLLSHPTGLLVAHAGGVLRLSERGPETLFQSKLHCISLRQATQVPSRVLLGDSDGVHLLEWREGRLEEGLSLTGLGQIRQILEDEQNTFWLSTSTRGLHHLSFNTPDGAPHIKTLSKENGGLEHNSTLIFQDGPSVLASAGGASWYPNIDDTGSGPAREARLRPLGAIGAHARLGPILAVSATEKGGDRVRLLWSPGPGVALRPLPNEIQQRLGPSGANLLLLEQGMSGPVLWARGLDLLLRIELNQLPTPTRAPQAKVRSLKLDGTPIPPTTSRIQIPYDARTLHLSYGGVALSEAANLTFQWRLLGLDETWSPWSDTRELTLQSLPAGKFDWQLRCRLADGEAGPVLALHLDKAQAPWLHPLAWLLYLLVALAAVAAYVRWRLHKAAEQTARLEALVTQRTVELAKARDAAESANRAKSTFLAAMNHELRTPLNGVLGYSQLLELDPSLGARQRDKVGVINRSGRHLLRLINEVLDLARLEAGAVPLLQESFNPVELLQDLIKPHGLKAAAKGLEMQLALDGLDDTTLQGDPVRIRQIVDNLLGNAVKFCPRGRITVHAWRTQEGVLAIEVADTGPGITKAEAKRLFHPFEQGLEGVASGGGTGLGLSIAHGLATAMGGSLSLRSEPGAGACFTLSLPLALAQAQQTAAPKDGPASPRHTGTPFEIWCADDNPENRELLCALLLELGLRARSFSDGEALLLALRHEPQAPSAIFLDDRMPGMDGLATASRIREFKLSPQPALILHTASQTTTAAPDALAPNAFCAILPKPFSTAELMALLEAYTPARWETQKDQARTEKVKHPIDHDLRQALLRQLDAGDLAKLRKLLEGVDAALVSNSLAQQLSEAAARLDMARLRFLLEEASTGKS